MSGRLRVSPDVAWVEDDGAVYLARVPEGPPLVLDGSGVLIWRALVAGGTVAEVRARVAADAGVSPEVVADDVTAFVARLVSGGLVDQH